MAQQQRCSRGLVEILYRKINSPRMLNWADIDPDDYTLGVPSALPAQEYTTVMDFVRQYLKSQEGVPRRITEFDIVSVHSLAPAAGHLAFILVMPANLPRFHNQGNFEQADFTKLLLVPIRNIIFPRFT